MESTASSKILALLIAIVGSSLILVGSARADGGTKVIQSSKQLTWGPAPPNFAEGAQVAVLQGDPGKPGIYTVRFKMPSGYKVAPHWQPADVAVTMISGSAGIGFGDKFDKSVGKLMNQGGFVIEPKEVHRYVWAVGPTIIQVQGEGPLVTNYVNPADDPSAAAHR
ncbi:MAG TPA: cupin domain-containing protein [Candidatus Binataceae bacterium]|nr:cupin domain-containing protein [Candidatus Binataceae bacterium]